MEFLRMSAGGYSMLADLIADLERPQTGVTRQERLLEHSRWLLRNKSGLGSVLDDSTAIVGTIMPAQSAQETSPAASRYAWARGGGATSVDIFV